MFLPPVMLLFELCILRERYVSMAFMKKYIHVAKGIKVSIECVQIMQASEACKPSEPEIPDLKIKASHKVHKLTGVIFKA